MPRSGRNARSNTPPATRRKSGGPTYSTVLVSAAKEVDEQVRGSGNGGGGGGSGGGGRGRGREKKGAVTVSHDGLEITSPMHPAGVAEPNSPPMEDVDLDSPPHADGEFGREGEGRGLKFAAGGPANGADRTDGSHGTRANGGSAEVSGPQLSIDDVLDICGTGHFHWRLLLIAGLAFAGDAVEVTLLSFLSPCAQATWGLTNVEAASIASAVFGGELVGAIVLGQAADQYGRRPLYFVSCFLILVPGLISVVSPNYVVLLVARTMVGFGVGGLSVPFTILAECLCTKDRGPILLFIEIFWTLGSMFTAAAAWIFLGSSGTV